MGIKFFFTGNGINSNSSGPTGTQLIPVFTFQHHGYCSTSDFISFMDDFFLVFMTWVFVLKRIIAYWQCNWALNFCIFAILRPRIWLNAYSSHCWRFKTNVNCVSTYKRNNHTNFDFYIASDFMSDPRNANGFTMMFYGSLHEGGIMVT